MAETVGDILSRNPQWEGEGEPQPEIKPAPCMPARLDGQPAFPTPGIYFGMDEGVYHAINAFSGSLAKKLAISLMDAWACSPLNTDREDDDTEFKSLGRAYHVRICEGLAAYNQRYAIALDKADYPNALMTVDQIKAAIVAAGEKPTGKRKEDWIAQLLDIDPAAEIWDAMKDAHEAANDGRELISAKQHRRIEIAARMIEADAALSKAFSGGYAEIAIFWFDEKTGCPCKAKLDYTKLSAIVDLKSFSNSLGRPVDRAIDFTIANQRHYLAVMVYREAVAAAKRMISGCGDAVIACNPTMTKTDRDAAAVWAHKLAAQAEPPTALYVYQATGQAPVTRGRIMTIGTVATVTDGYLQAWKRRYVEATKTYGADPWIDVAPIRATADEDVPLSATDLGE